MSANFIFRIEVFTSKLLFVGSYTQSMYRRLSDALNSDLNLSILLTDVIIAPLERPQQAQRVAKVMVDRSNVVLVTALQEPKPPPDYNPPGQATHREIIPAMFFTSAGAVEGKLAKRVDMGLDEAIKRDGEDFVPLKEARIIPFSSTNANPKAVARDFVCLGRLHIHALYPISAASPRQPIALDELKDRG